MADVFEWSKDRNLATDEQALASVNCDRENI